MIKLNFYKKILILLFIVIATVNITAQNGGVASKYSGLVNAFTGDFNYSIPLLTVPSPDGGGIPLTLGYSAGIRVNQEASWVGLGWDLNPGEIRRKVNGVPDDWKDVQVTDIELTTTTNRFYGPFHFKDFFEHSTIPEFYNYNSNPDNYTMDLYQSDRGASDENIPFEFPDFDEYYVSAPGYGGTMKPFLFDFAYLYYKNQNSLSFGNHNDNSYYVPFTKKPQFRFTNEPVGNIYTPYYGNMNNYYNITGTLNYHYCNWVYDPITEVYTCIDTYKYNEGNVLSKFLAPEAFENSFYYGSGVDASTGIPDQQNYIEYFTNDEINNFNPDAQVANSLNDRGFLDYRDISGTRRPTSDFDANGIGAIKITSPEGLTYHYSLPIYSYNEKIFDIQCYSDWTLYNDVFWHEFQKPNKYAYTWKLTAITGPDFEDFNNNGIADIGDKGYWVAYEYELWANEYKWRDPYYDGIDRYYYNLDYRNYVSEYRTEPTSKKYTKKASYMEGSMQVYFLKSIQTSAYTAYFFKDIRKDVNSVNISDKYTPKLLLKYIVLVDNSIPALTTYPLSAGTDYSTTTGLNYDILNVNTYNNSINNNILNSHSLKTIEFVYDYSLASGVYNNINTLKGNNSNDGKLTLTELKVYEKGKTQVFNPYLFEYSHNTAFNHEQQDFFGYLKLDYDITGKGGYIASETDKSFVDAWSLNKITTPEGVELTVEYESDDYTKDSYDRGTSTSSIPYPNVTRVFPIKNVSLSLSGAFKITLDDNDGYNLLTQTTNIKKRKLYFNCTCNSTPDAFVESDDFENVSGEIIPNNLNVICSSVSYSPDPYLGYVVLDLLKVYGGGTRVKSLQVKDTKQNQQYGLEYEYANGVVTTEPDLYGHFKYSTHYLQASNHFGDRHALPSEVGYENITVKEIGTDGSNIGKTVYEYNTSALSFQPIRTNTRSSIKYFQQPMSDSWQISDYEINEIYIKDRFGLLKSVKTYNTNNNIVSSKSIEYDFIGETNESFYRYFYKGYFENSYSNRAVFKKVYYTPVPKVITETIDNISTETRIISRDLLTGVPTETQISSPANNTIVISKTPAYLSNPKLGLKCRDLTNLNILTAQRKEVSLSGGQITGGANTIWSETNPVRKYDNGQYITTSESTMLIPVNSYSYNGVSDENSWLKTSENTLINKKNMMLEVKNENDVYSSLIYGYNDKFKIAEAINAKYTDIAYASAEETTDINKYFSGEVKLGTGIISTTQFHTGSKSIQANNLETAFVYEFNNSEFDVNKSYKISVRAKEDNTTAHEATIKVTYYNSSQTIIHTEEINTGNSSIKKFGDWYLLNFSTSTVATIPALSNVVKVLVETLNKTGGSTSCYFDDFRIKPEDASMSTYVYDEFTGNVIASHDNENLSTTYQYDNAGRITITKTEAVNGFKKSSEYNYYQSNNQ